MTGTKRATDGDRAGKRKRYLMQEAGASSQAFIGLIVTCLFGCLSLAFAVVSMGLADHFIDGIGPEGVQTSSEAPAPVPIGLAIEGPLGLILCGSLTYAGYTMVRSGDDKDIIYVPPVRAQIAALPADEILVRSSDQTPALPEELLRSVRQTAVAPQEELLRAQATKQL